MEKHTSDVLAYLGRIYDPESRPHACRANSPGEFASWQRDARPALRRLIGLDRIEESLGEHVPSVELGDSEDMGDYTRQSGILHSEPNIQVPFWLLRPKTTGPYPLGLFPHGHEERGMDTYVDIYPDEAKRQKIQSEDRDVAVQAVRRGFIAIAPTTRGFAPANIPDINDRHGGRHCRSQFLHCLLGGRTAIGERVWDLERLLDWALSDLDIDADRVLMMGNSGGGVATLYASACDIRVTTAVPSCSFCTFVGENGLVHHCDCNAVPGILRFGEFYDVAGLIAPHPLLTVNGSQDTLFPLSEVDRAVEGVRKIYQAAGTPERYVHQYGDGGHRFYSDLMWPFIDRYFVSQNLSPKP
jgi:dienelactone hydrolase